MLKRGQLLVSATEQPCQDTSLWALRPEATILSLCQLPGHPPARERQMTSMQRGQVPPPRGCAPGPAWDLPGVAGNGALPDESSGAWGSPRWERQLLLKEDGTVSLPQALLDGRSSPPPGDSEPEAPLEARG